MIVKLHDGLAWLVQDGKETIIDCPLADRIAFANKINYAENLVKKYDGLTIKVDDTTMKIVGDPVETTRRQMVDEINAHPISEREAMEQKHGKVWTTAELSEDFEVLGFMAPFVVVVRKSDGKRGTLEFQHMPRFYYGFAEE